MLACLLPFCCLVVGVVVGAEVVVDVDVLHLLPHHVVVVAVEDVVADVLHHPHPHHVEADAEEVAEVDVPHLLHHVEADVVVVLQLEEAAEVVRPSEVVVEAVALVVPMHLLQFKLPHPTLPHNSPTLLLPHSNPMPLLPNNNPTLLNQSKLLHSKAMLSPNQWPHLEAAPTSANKALEWSNQSKVTHISYQFLSWR